MKIKKKRFFRRGWKRARKRTDFPWEQRIINGCQSVVGVFRIDEVTEPLVWTIGNQNFILADDGYYWLQWIPDGRHYALTVMLDKQKNIIEYYFDVTLENIVDGADSYFRDLFLDVVLLPDGSIHLLDKDELDQALEEGVISEEAYQLACREAQKLMEDLPGKQEPLAAFVHSCLQELM